MVVGVFRGISWYSTYSGWLVVKSSQKMTVICDARRDTWRYLRQPMVELHYNKDACYDNFLTSSLFHNSNSIYKKETIFLVAKSYLQDREFDEYKLFC